jgi:hypothetical protein
MRSPSSRKCCHCREHFVPSPNNRRSQRYCSKPLCRKASKAGAQAKWSIRLRTATTSGGAENVERVRQWRRGHPGYWRKKRAAEAAKGALQDLAPNEVVGPEAVTVQEQALSRGADLVSEREAQQQELALQDLASCQVPLLAGVVSLLIGEGLQDRFAHFTRQLVDRGRRVLAAER